MSKKLFTESSYEIDNAPICCGYLNTKYCPHGKIWGNSDVPCLNEGIYGDKVAGCVRVAAENKRREKEGELAGIG